jgi:hypothetical protein
LLGGLVPQAQSSAATPKPAASPAQSGGFSLDDLLKRVGSGNPQRLSASYLQSTGLAAELAQQTGLDHNTATASLQEAFLALSGHVSAAKPAAAPQPQSKTKKPRSKTQPKKKTPTQKRGQSEV